METSGADSTTGTALGATALVIAAVIAGVLLVIALLPKIKQFWSSHFGASTGGSKAGGTEGSGTEATKEGVAGGTRGSGAGGAGGSGAGGIAGSGAGGIAGSGAGGIAGSGAGGIAGSGAGGIAGSGAGGAGGNTVTNQPDDDVKVMSKNPSKQKIGAAEQHHFASLEGISEGDTAQGTDIPYASDLLLAMEDPPDTLGAATDNLVSELLPEPMKDMYVQLRGPELVDEGVNSLVDKLFSEDQKGLKISEGLSRVLGEEGLTVVPGIELPVPKEKVLWVPMETGGHKILVPAVATEDVLNM